MLNIPTIIIRKIFTRGLLGAFVLLFVTACSGGGDSSLTGQEGGAFI